MIAYVVALIVIIVTGAGGLCWLGYKLVTDAKFRSEFGPFAFFCVYVPALIVSLAIVIDHHSEPKQHCICVPVHAEAAKESK